MQVEFGFRRRDDAEIETVFHKYATSSSGPGSVHHIKKDRLLVALKEFDASIGDITREDVSREDAIFRSLDRNGDGILDLSEFKQAVKTPSALEEWAQSPPLAQLLVDAIPKKVGRDHLRVTSGLTTEDVDEVCDGFSAGLRRILNESVGQLKAAFESMDRARENPAGGKFPESVWTFLRTSCGAGASKTSTRGCRRKSVTCTIFSPFILSQAPAVFVPAAWLSICK
jgi:hypothetical protein